MITRPGILLIVEFDWPIPFALEHGASARALHDAVIGSDWVEEVAAGSGGIGSSPSSVWIFRFQNYAALDRLMGKPTDPVSSAYIACFKHMVNVAERVRGEVFFSPAPGLASVPPETNPELPSPRIS